MVDIQDGMSEGAESTVRALPSDAAVYQRTDEFSAVTLPGALRKRHSTKAGVWARICVLEGRSEGRTLPFGSPRDR